MKTYLLISYLVGVLLFVVETILTPAGQRTQLLNFRAVLWVLSPLTAWHGILHYLQFAWCKLTKQPIKYWI
jgi:hypothetical protein